MLAATYDSSYRNAVMISKRQPKSGEMLWHFIAARRLTVIFEHHDHIGR
jgi:hypothetical protein